MIQMRRFLAGAALLVLSTVSAFAGQIDAVLKFTDKATAIADATAATQTYTDAQGAKQWLLSNCIEATVWRNSQDTTTGTGTLADPFVTVHHPLAGYYLIVSLDHVVPALLNHAAVVLVIDRDKMNARTPGFVLKSTVTNTVLQDLRISPVFAGSDFAWGAMN